MSENIREITLDLLYTLETENKKSHLLIREVLLKYDFLDRRDKAFIKRVSEGTIANRITLDYVLDKYSKKPMAKCKPLIRVLLRMSAYQLLFMDKIPGNAVCDEAVKLCRKRSFEAFCPFVNALLRNVSNNRESCLDFSNITDRAERLSVTYSMPGWLVDMFLKEHKDAEALLASLCKVRPTCVRLVDSSYKDEFIKEISKAGISFRASEYVPDAFLLEDFEGSFMIPGFEDGKLIIQDESSMLASMALGVNKGSNLSIIDTCAAPGGKTSFVASLMNPKGHILSCDVSERKTDLIRENIERLGFSNVEVKTLDATTFDESLKESADIVLCDVPCSGLGVMGRKSDIRYNISNEAMKEICDLQKKIVTNVSQYVKKGGILVYSTCTIHKAENEKMAKFITSNLPFEGDSLKPFLPEKLGVGEDEYMLSLLPHIHNTDGFFVARFRRL